MQHDMMMWGEDEESLCDHAAGDEETRTHLQDLILLSSTQQLRKLHLSAPLMGSTQFHDWLK